MFKLIGTITNAVCTITTDLTEAVLPLTSSAKHASKALEYHAKELELDAKFECDKKAQARATALAEFEATLKAIPTKTNNKAKAKA